MEENGKMERGLKPRHVEMIALGGTIGVGQYDYDGWSVSPLVLRIDGCRHVLHHAHYGGNALSGTGNGLLCNVWS